ncbi:unnamed protein product, partial [Prorocentrum cordatum]
RLNGLARGALGTHRQSASPAPWPRHFRSATPEMPSPLDKGSPWLFADAASATFAGSLGEQSPFHDLPLPSWGRLTLKPHGPLKKGSRRPLATAAASTFTGPLGEGRPFGDLPLPSGACDLRLGSRGLTGVKRRASTGTLTLPRGGPLILDGAPGSTRLGHYSLVNLGALGLDHCGSRPVGSPAGATHQPGSRPQARAAPRPLPAAREPRAADLLGLSVVRGPSLPELALGAPESARAYLPSALRRAGPGPAARSSPRRPAPPGRGGPGGRARAPAASAPSGGRGGRCRRTGGACPQVASSGQRGGGAVGAETQVIEARR